MKIRPMILGVVVAGLLLIAAGAATGADEDKADTRTGVAQTVWSDQDLR